MKPHSEQVASLFLALEALVEAHDELEIYPHHRRVRGGICAPGCGRCRAKRELIDAFAFAKRTIAGEP